MALAVPLRAIAAAVFIHTLWGANPVAVKFGLEAFPPLWSAFFRFSIAILCVAAWARLRGIRMWPTRQEWLPLLIIAVLFTVQIGLMNVGYDRTTGAMGSVLIATNPLFSVVFAHLLVAGDRLSALRCLGLVVAMAGTAVTLLQDADLAALDFGAVGNWIVLSSACILGLRLALSARALKNIDEVRVALWQAIIALPLFAAGGALFEQIRWENVGPAPLAGIAYQAIAVAGIAFMVNFHLMKRYTPSVIMSFNFVSPVAGVLLAIWLLGDGVSTAMMAGLALVALGLALITRKPVGAVPSSEVSAETRRLR
jgi:drug/metabolite transporter (DMT)-like permease